MFHICVNVCGNAGTRAGTKISSLLCKTCPNEEFSDRLSEYMMFFREDRHQTDSAVDSRSHLFSCGY